MTVHALVFIEFGDVSCIKFFRSKRAAIEYLAKNHGTHDERVAETVKQELYYGDGCGFEVVYCKGGMK